MRKLSASESRRSVILAVLLASYSLVYFHRTMTGVMEAEITSISRQYGYNPELILSILASAYFYAYSLTQFAVGSLIDYYGIKRIGSTLLLLLALGTLLIAPQDPTVMVIGRVVVGFTSVAAFLSYQRSLSLYYKPEEQVRATALALAAGNFTAVVATYPLRLALDTVGVSGTIAALVITTLAISISVYLASTDVRSSGDVREYFTKTKANLREVVFDRHSWGVSIGALATYGTGLSFQSSWGQLLLSRAFNMDRVEVSFHLLILAAVFMAMCPIFGYLSDKVFHERKPFLLISSISMAFSWLLLLVSSTTASRPLLLISLLSLGISLGPHIVISVMMREAHGIARAATSVAFMNTVLFLGVAVLNTVLPQLKYSEAIGVSLALAILGTAAVYFLTRETYSRR
ncbi:MAG: MFS transporter [Sulfolobales archaeon]|nr:MFS transporter [Sulfolobales archaeon]MDW8082819.1 MFS transporter [Sulfolobales archaeon]